MVKSTGRDRVEAWLVASQAARKAGDHAGARALWRRAAADVEIEPGELERIGKGLMKLSARDEIGGPAPQEVLLLGQVTTSYLVPVWTAVAHGRGLSLVVIDRLPFNPPDDPVLAACIERINRSGGNAFMEYQVPRAVISLKQGAGRLIRDEADRGALMICDPPLVDKPYGRRMWRALPPFRRTRRIEDVEAFFSRRESPAASLQDRS